jgi:hypothetical protein
MFVKFWYILIVLSDIGSDNVLLFLVVLRTPRPFICLLGIVFTIFCHFIWTTHTLAHISLSHLSIKYESNSKKRWKLFSSLRNRSNEPVYGYVYKLLYCSQSSAPSKSDWPISFWYLTVGDGSASGPLADAQFDPPGISLASPLATWK